MTSEDKAKALGSPEQPVQAAARGRCLRRAQPGREDRDPQAMGTRCSPAPGRHRRRHGRRRAQPAHRSQGRPAEAHVARSKKTARRPRSARDLRKSNRKWRRPGGSRHPRSPLAGQPGRCAANSFWMQRSRGIPTSKQAVRRRIGARSVEAMRAVARAGIGARCRRSQLPHPVEPPVAVPCRLPDQRPRRFEVPPRPLYRRTFEGRRANEAFRSFRPGRRDHRRQWRHRPRHGQGHGGRRRHHRGRRPRRRQERRRGEGAAGGRRQGQRHSRRRPARRRRAAPDRPTR